MASYGVGASLAGMGVQQEQNATQMLAEASRQETDRNNKNKMIKAENKTSAESLGGTVGAMVGAGGVELGAAGAEFGMVGGPMGALIGGTLGAIAGGILSRYA